MLGSNPLKLIFFQSAFPLISVSTPTPFISFSVSICCCRHCSLFVYVAGEKYWTEILQYDLLRERIVSFRFDCRTARATALQRQRQRQELVPNFSGNEFAYGQRHIVFWLSAIVTAIDSASWPVGRSRSQSCSLEPGAGNRKVFALDYLLFTIYQRLERRFMCVQLVAKWPIRFCSRSSKQLGFRMEAGRHSGF